MTYRSREHFLQILSWYLSLAKSGSLNEEEMGSIAYAVHNIPSYALVNEWTDEHSKDAWWEVRQSAGVRDCLGWLEETDKLIFEQTSKDSPLIAEFKPYKLLKP